MAIRIVADATLKLNVAMAAQSKRLYYIPVGRFSRGESRRTDGIRNKALFSDLHLLQRLLYVESEPYERQKERAAQVAPPGVHAVGDPASEEDLLVYFVKHLVRITTKRNSFYVTLGVSRLLHSYTTLETMELYNAVIGEPERVKDDYYYRSRKAVLMHEMYQRFGQLIRACRQRRGEERFETQPGSSEQRSLVRECLRLFTPWDTQCPVPRDFDPLKSVIASLTSKSNAGENEVEANRIHAVLHPECFERLVAAFGYRSPAERMELPRFFLDQTNDQSPPPRQRNAPADLSAEELAEINDMLAEQAGRRRRSSPDAVLRVIVDGVEQCRLNPAQESSVSFNVGEDSELIEVKTTDDLLLATYLLNDAHDDASIRLEGGQYLSLSISKSGTEFLVKLGYQETSARRAVRLWWQRLGLRLVPEQGLSARLVFVACVVVMIFLMGYLAYVRLRSKTNEPRQNVIVQATPISLPSPEVITSTPTPAASQSPRRSRTKIATVPAPSPDEDVDLTRSGAVVPDLKLSEVKKIYVQMRGDTGELRTSLVEGLGIVAVTNADDADAALKVVVLRTSGTQIEVSAQLVNARGTILWPKSPRHYSGETSKVASEIVRDLVNDHKKAQKNTKGT